MENKKDDYCSKVTPIMLTNIGVKIKCTNPRNTREYIFNNENKNRVIIGLTADNFKINDFTWIGETKSLTKDKKIIDVGYSKYIASIK